MRSYFQNKKGILIRLLIGIGILIGLFQIPNLTYVDDANSYTFIPETDAQTKKELDSKFATGEKQSIIIISHQQSWTNYKNLKLLSAIRDSVEIWGNNINTTAITSIQLGEKYGFGIRNKKRINLETKAGFNKWLTTKSNYADINSKFISANGKYALIYYQNENLPKKIRQKLSSLNGSIGIQSVYYFDSTQFNSELKANAQYNLIFTSLISLFLTAFAFFFLTKSVKGLWLISTMIAFNIAMVILVMAVLNISIGPHISAIPSIIVVMSFSDIMHIIYHHKYLAKAIKNTKNLRKTLRSDLFYPILLTSLTNAIGFIVYLIVSTNQYITDLGLIALIGVGIAYLSAKLIVIPLIRVETIYMKEEVVQQIEFFYKRINVFIHPHKKRILGVFMVLTIGLLVFVSSVLHIESSSRAFVSSSSNTAKGQLILEKHFFGNQSIEILVTNTSGKTLLANTIPQQMENIENIASQTIAPLYISDPLIVLKRYNRFRIGGHAKTFKLPPRFSATMQKEFYAIAGSLGWGEVVSDNEEFAKIQMGFKNYSLQNRLAIYAQLEKKIKPFNTKNISFKLTGKSYLQDKGEAGFIKWALIGFILAFLIAGFIVFFILKSVYKVVVFILVNLLPLVFALFLMWLFAIPINTVSIFMLSVLVGLCLDDSIYLITISAKEKEIRGIYPIIVTTVVLAVGILALSFSNYQWLRPFSFIFSAAFLVSLFADIIILPLLLSVKEK